MILFSGIAHTIQQADAHKTAENMEGISASLCSLDCHEPTEQVIVMVEFGVPYELKFT